MAARRREAWKSGRSRPKASGKPKDSRGRAKKGSGRSPTGQLVRFALLMAAMVVVGFCVVFVIDTGIGWVKKADFGGQSAAALFDKIVDRVLDRDVPRKEEEPRQKVVEKKKPPPPQKRARPAAAPAQETARAELPAPPPDAYAAAAEAGEEGRLATTDPKVEEAKERLNAILQRHGLSN